MKSIRLVCLIVFLFAMYLSFKFGEYREMKSEDEVKRTALIASSNYIDSIILARNILDSIRFVVIPYSKEIERYDTKLNTNGYVPDEKAAARIAVSVWSALFGEFLPDNKYPLEISLKHDSLWIVRGTLSPNSEGGTPYIEIAKRNGLIYKVNQEK